MYRMIFTLWGLGMCLMPQTSCAQSEAEPVLQATFNYVGLTSFWCSHPQGYVQLSDLQTGRQLSIKPPFSLFNQEIGISYEVPDTVRYALRIQKFRMNADRSEAKVRFTYDQRVKATIKLFWEGESWRVKRAWIRQKYNCRGRRSSQFVWDFLTQDSRCREVIICKAASKTDTLLRDERSA